MTNFEWLKLKDIETFSKFLSSSFDCSCCIIKDQCDLKYKCESNIVKWLNMDINDIEKEYYELNGPIEGLKISSKDYVEDLLKDVVNDANIYIFPAIFKEDLFDDNKTIYVSFPDLENCFTDGIDLKNAIKNAKEALGNVIYWMKKEGHVIPTPSDIRDISINEENEIKSLIYIDLREFKNDWENKTNFEKIKNIEISGIKPFESLDGESVLAIFLSNNYSNCKECKFKSNDTCIGCISEIEKWLKIES